MPSRWENVEERVPGALDDLHGPAEGVVALPLHLAWSGLREYNVSDQRLRMSMYQVVLAEGRRSDVERYICAEHLRADWPSLRKLMGRQLRQAWETHFPSLADR